MDLGRFLDTTLEALNYLFRKRPRPVLFARMTLAAMPESTREEAGSLDFGALVLWTWFGEKKVERH